MFIIRIGLEENLDVSWYTKKEFNTDQMREIRLGLIYNEDVSKYAKPEYSCHQMEEIREKLKNGKNI